MKIDQSEKLIARPLTSFLGNINTRLFIFLIFLLQVVIIFQGFDLSDEGFLSTFYRRIFSNPDSVSYCFMFWLTGMIGGTWAKISAPFGLMGIRLGGVLVNTLSVYLTYRLLRKYLNDGYLKLGLLLVVLFLNNDIKVLNYNILSGLFYIIVVHFLFTGLLKKQGTKIFLSGVFIGLNVFIRTPNILELGLVTGILYYHYLNPQPRGYILKQLGSLIGGFLVSVGLVLFTMYLMGHLQIFLGSMNMLFNLGKGVKRQEIEGGYGMSRLIDLFRSNMVMSLKYAAIPLCMVLGGLFILNRFGNKIKSVRGLIYLVFTGGLFAVLFLIIRHKIDHFTVLFFITGLILLSALSIFTSTVSKEIKLLFFFGCFFLLSFPLGSSDGIWTAGRYCLWIGLPIAVDYIMQIQSASLSLSVLIDKKDYQGKLWATASQLSRVKNVLMLLLVFAGFYHLYFYPFFDRRNRSKMHFALESANLRGVYTTQGRADIMNELFQESRKRIGENEYVIAYDNLAMYYYATNTIPQIPNPLPAVYSADLFRADINSIPQKNKKLPPIIRQKIATTGDASKWPEETLPGAYFENDRNRDRNLVLDSFITSNHYKEVWSNKAFMILMPEEAYLPVK